MLLYHLDRDSEESGGIGWVDSSFEHLYEMGKTPTNYVRRPITLTGHRRALANRQALPGGIGMECKGDL